MQQNLKNRFWTFATPWEFYERKMEVDKKNEINEFSRNFTRIEPMERRKDAVKMKGPKGDASNCFQGISKKPLL